jgi:hypothetical protein
MKEGFDGSEPMSFRNIYREFGWANSGNILEHVANEGSFHWHIGGGHLLRRVEHCQAHQSLNNSTF